MKLAEVGGDRFWEAWREGDTVHAVSGSGAGKPRTTHKAFPDEAAAENDLQARFRAKFREGWVFQAPDPDTAGWHPTLMTQVSRVHTGFLSIDYSPARDLIAVGRPLDSTPTPTCELVRIDPRSGAVRDTVPLKTFDLWQVRFAPDGDRIYVRADGLVACVEPATQARTRHFATPPFTFLDFQLSRGGRRLLGSDHSRMVVKDLDSGALLLERPLTELREHRHSRAAALSPSGGLAALAEEPGKIELFNLETGEHRTVTGDFPFLKKLLFHPSESYLILMEHYEDLGLHVIDLNTGEALPRFRSADARTLPCHDVDVSGDGRLLARGAASTISLHDFETGEVVQELRQQFAVRHYGFAFTFAGTSDTLLSRVDLGIVTLYRRGPEEPASLPTLAPLVRDC